MALKLTAADLKVRITFQQPTIVTDAGGGKSTTFANVASVPTVWAQWVNDHGQELQQAGAYVSEQRATVRIRRRTDILETWQVLKDGNAWRILSIDSMQDNHWIELRVERIKATV